MKDQTETPLTERKVLRRGVTSEAGAMATIESETDAPAVTDLNAEVANLRLLIRQQDALVARLLSERAGSDVSSVKAAEATRPKTKAKRSTRRGLLTQLAAGAAGVAAAAVYGSAKAGTASAEAYGTIVGPSSNKSGVFGYPNGVTPITNVQTAAAAGVWGQRDSGAPDPVWDAGVTGISNIYSGVLGRSTSSTGVRGYSNGFYGVYGDSQSSHGVFGSTDSSSSSYGGVLGLAQNGASAGVYGLHTDSGPGVRGESTSGPGVYGKSTNQPGVDGVSTNSLGLRGTSTNFVGIVGISTNNHGLYGSTSSPTNYGIIAENTTPGGGPGLYVTGNAFIKGSLQVTGAKNAVVKMQDGSDGVVYCQEAPEPYFEDFGRTKLVGGVANVPLEREFAQLMAGGEYYVFLTPEGATQGLYVSKRNANGFEVRDTGNGNSAFSYRIVTRRKDIEGKRFARVTHDAAEKIPSIRATLAAMGTLPSAGPAPQQPGQGGGR